MPQWPHAPIHLFDEVGTYMITSGTYLKLHLFDTPEKIGCLHDTLIETAGCFGWRLHAWTVMQNHYHFVADSPDNPGSLTEFIRNLHKKSAKQINMTDGTPGRRVWFQYWDSRITFRESWLARLKYVHNNPVHHSLVDNAGKYPWCSSAWFAREADSAFYKTVCDMKTDRINVKDDF